MVDTGHWQVDKMDRQDTEHGGTELSDTEAVGSLLHQVEEAVRHHSQLKHDNAAIYRTTADINTRSRKYVNDTHGNK